MTPILAPFTGFWPCETEQRNAAKRAALLGSAGLIDGALLKVLDMLRLGYWSGFAARA